MNLTQVLDVRQIRQVGRRIAGIESRCPGARALGPAFPVIAGDGWWLERAIHAALPGEVLVVVPDPVSGVLAGWDAGLTRSAAARTLGGLVVAGTVQRGRHGGWPVFATGVAPPAPGPRRRGEGELGEPVTIGDVTVALGDLLLCDDAGVLCVPRSELVRCSVTVPGQAAVSR